MPIDAHAHLGKSWGERANGVAPPQFFHPRTFISYPPVSSFFEKFSKKFQKLTKIRYSFFHSEQF